MYFDRIYRPAEKEQKFAQALSYAKANMTGQWRVTDKPTRHVPTDEITNSIVIGALHQLSLWDEFYESHLAKIRSSELLLRRLFVGPLRYFYDVLDDCGIERQGIVDFNCAVGIQRVDSDRTVLSRLENYLGCRIADE